MTEISHFNGRLLCRTLPALTPHSGAELPQLKRLILPQGELAQFHDSAEGARYIAALELNPGGVRGNHVHAVKEEHLYVIRGRIRLVAEDVTSGDRVELELGAGDLAVIHPAVAHAFRVLEEGVAVEFAPGRFDPADVQRHSVMGT